jgi:hypothetical protein
VPASGGAVVPLTKTDKSRKEVAHGYPQLLPGDRVLYFVASNMPEVAGAYVVSLDRPDTPVRVLATSSKAIYAPPVAGRSGHLIWMREQNLVAQAFDLETLRLTGEPTTLASDVAAIQFRPAFWASPAGTLAYFVGDDLGPKNMSWFDRDGRKVGDAARADFYRAVRISPDGTRVGVTKNVKNIVEAWVLEFARGSWTRLGADKVDLNPPFWSPDGRELGFGRLLVEGREWTGASPSKPLTTANVAGQILDWSSDGRFLLVGRPAAGPGDYWMASIDGSVEPRLIVGSPANERDGRFSPDGKWLAYSSDETGRAEVYVQSVSGSERRWPVSVAGGDRPVWRRDGREVYFVAPSSDTIMGATIREVGPTLEVGAPRQLFTTPDPLIAGYPSTYDVAPDGRFLMLTGENRGPAVLTVVLNWQAQLGRR